MTNDMKKVVVDVLRRSLGGLANVQWRRSEKTGLSWWQIAINKSMLFIGADQPPFIDPLNWSKITLEFHEKQDLILDALQELSSENV